MNNCKSFEKLLPAYIHGELYESDYHALRAHLENCAACRTELEVQRVTLELLGDALSTAPSPVRMSGWRHRPRRQIDLRRNAFSRVWYSPQFKATLATGMIAACFFFISGLFVVFTVLPKEAPEFNAPPPMARPSMKLKKPKVMVKKSSQPKPSSRIVAKVKTEKMPEMQIPDLVGTGEGLMGGLGSGDEFMDIPEIEEVTVFGGAVSLESEPALKSTSVYGYSASMDDRSVSTLEQHDQDAYGDPFANEVAMDKSTRGSDLAFGLDDSMDDLFGRGTLSVSGSIQPERVSGIMDRNGALLNDRLSEQKQTTTEKGERQEILADRKKDWSADFETEPVAMPRERRPAVFNPYVMAVDNAFSTFSIDVDTASYGLARRQLLSGALPETESVRTEEFINSFDYDYRPPAGKQTFAVHSEMAPSPFRGRMEVLKVGIKGRRIGRDDHRKAVLTLVIDTSGSMSTPERLGLVKQSLALLIDQLDAQDEVAIVQFGGAAHLVLEHTPVSEKETVLAAINALQPGGPTQFDKGLELGYQMAADGFHAGDSNRIIIMSDGVANLGELDPDTILAQVADYRTKGIYLSVLGFGAGTYDDDLLERLANRSDGMYAYVGTMDEARQLFVDQLAATLHVIASDVKIQIEFNPDRVLRYRQLGYENRQLTKEQFRDDTVDAGEVGSGQSVTALYDVELKPGGSEQDPIATIYVRYRRADNGAIEEISSRVMDTDRKARFEDADARFQLSACVAEFAERLRRSPYAQGTEITDILARMQPVVLTLDLDDQVRELQQLISIAAGLEN